LLVSAPLFFRWFPHHFQRWYILIIRHVTNVRQNDQ
jgi:hypothetical protein